MKRNLSILALLTFVATTMIAVYPQVTDAAVTKVMVIHVTSESITPGTPFITYPDPGLYGVFADGKIIEVADSAAEVLVGNGDILVSDVFGEGDPIPQKGDNVSVIYELTVNADGSETRGNYQLQ